MPLCSLCSLGACFSFFTWLTSSNAVALLLITTIKRCTTSAGKQLCSISCHPFCLKKQSDAVAKPYTFKREPAGLKQGSRGCRTSPRMELAKLIAPNGIWGKVSGPAFLNANDDEGCLNAADFDRYGWRHTGSGSSANRRGQNRMHELSSGVTWSLCFHSNPCQFSPICMAQKGKGRQQSADLASQPLAHHV